MKVGIIGAMDVEVASLKEKMQNSMHECVAGQDYVSGKLGSTECVIVKCGVGKVRAAMAVQVLCDHFHVTHIINTGVAGSLNNAIDIGDIVISKDAVFHDVDATNFGYALGEIPQLGTCFFQADEGLQKLAMEAVRQAAPEVNPFSGRIASGDQFVRTEEKKKWIKENFQADCCEMEGAAIAEASFLNQVPFVILRAISDKADEKTSVSYDEFEAAAAKHCAAVTAYMVSHL